ELKQGAVHTSYLEPETFGIQQKPIDYLRGGDAEVNGRILRDILELKSNGAKQEVVLLNAAAGIYVSGTAKSIAEGFVLAQQSIQSRSALEKLEQLIVLSNGGGGV